MTDYLLVHGAGQGAWSWGQVWGYLTAPVTHPPRLYSPRPANRVYPLDLPGHGADAGGDTGAVRLEECVHSITRAVEREGLSDLVIAAHGFSACMVLQAAEQLAQAPKRVVLIAGVIPPYGGKMGSVVPQPAKSGLRARMLLSRLAGRDAKLSKSMIKNLLCNGMEPREVVHVVGRFGALPTRVLTTKVALNQPERPYPVTYVVLTGDRFLPAGLQRQMAQRVPGGDVETAEVDSCHQAALYRPREVADLLLSYS